MNARPLAYASTMISGIVTIRDLDPVVALVETIERLAMEGRGATWFLVDLFPFMTTAHWDAYAREARVPSPNPTVIAAVIEAYKKRVGYAGSSTT